MTRYRIVYHAGGWTIEERYRLLWWSWWWTMTDSGIHQSETNAREALRRRRVFREEYDRPPIVVHEE